MYKAGTTEFTDMVRQVGTSNDDAIMVSGFYPEAGAVIAEAKRQNLNLAFLGGDGWESDGLFSVAGDAITDKSRIYIASHFSTDVKRVKVRGFVSTFQERFGRRPNTSSALGFDAAGMAISAMLNATTLSNAGVRDALMKTRHEGATGHITIDDTRNPTKKVIILQARPDARFAYVQAIDASTLTPRAETTGQ